MMPDVVKVILLNECPSFDSNGFDNDISRYVSLMEQKQYKEACVIYEKYLVPRYPDELTRVNIIRYYRKGDVRFRELYAGAVRDILEKIITSIKKLIHHIVSIFDGQNNNPYELLKKIDLSLKVIPATKEKGLPFIKKLGTYSVLLNYMSEEFNVVLDILKSYFDNTLFVKLKTEEKPKNINPEKKPGKTKSEDIHHKEKKKKATIDLDKIVFSDEEIRMICINSEIKPKSFQALAYCKLYWWQILDHDFEKNIFLYSQKYDTKHFRIFQIIKNFRIRKMSDEVILLEVYSTLSSVYQYNVKEDAFMQQVWRKIKPVDPPETATPVVSKEIKTTDEKKKKPAKKVKLEKVRSEKKANAEKVRLEQKANAEKIRLEQKANAEKVRSEKKASAEKIRLEQKANAEKVRSEKKANAEKVRSEKKASVEKIRSEKKASVEKIRSEKKASAEKVRLEKKASAEKIRSEKKASVEKIRSEKKASVEKIRSEKKASVEKLKNAEVKVASKRKISAGKKHKDKELEEAELQRLRDIRYKTDAQVYSLHDRIQKLCIPDIFNAHNEFGKILPKHLDKYLVKHWKQGIKKDPYLLKGAAYIITTFLTENYNIVSPNWAGSLSCTEVMNIGFEVLDLEPMIKLCIEEIRMKRAAA